MEDTHNEQKEKLKSWLKINYSVNEKTSDLIEEKNTRKKVIIQKIDIHGRQSLNSYNNLIYNVL